MDAALRPDLCSEPLPGPGGGESLPAPVQAKMEDAMGTDFGDVRVHVDDGPARLGATAYASGNDLHFAPGTYDPSSHAGQALIGHELVHVVQQRAGRVALPQGKDGRVNHDLGLEAEADALGAAAAEGQRVSITGSTGSAGDAPHVQCTYLPPTELKERVNYEVALSFDWTKGQSGSIGTIQVTPAQNLPSPMRAVGAQTPSSALEIQYDPDWCGKIGREAAYRPTTAPCST